MIEARSVMCGNHPSGKRPARVGKNTSWTILVVLGVVLASCGNGVPIVLDESGVDWRAADGRCVRESDEGPVMRVINRTDPELCGRFMKNRPTEYVRIQRIPNEESD